MKFRIRYAMNIGTIREEDENVIKEFNRLDDFIKWCESLKDPVIIDYNKNKKSVPRELYVYNYWIE